MNPDIFRGVCQQGNGDVASHSMRSIDRFLQGRVGGVANLCNRCNCYFPLRVEEVAFIAAPNVENILNVISGLKRIAGSVRFCIPADEGESVPGPRALGSEHFKNAHFL